MKLVDVFIYLSGMKTTELDRVLSEEKPIAFAALRGFKVGVAIVVFALLVFLIRKGI